jgi:hypothetical protein
VETTVALPGTPRRKVCRFTSPEETCHATRRRRVAGSSEVSSIVMRLSGRTRTTLPSKNVISAVEPGPVRTRSDLRSVPWRSAAIHSNVPTALTFTLPTTDVKRALVERAIGAEGGGGATGRP